MKLKYKTGKRKLKKNFEQVSICLDTSIESDRLITVVYNIHSVKAFKRFIHKEIERNKHRVKSIEFMLMKLPKKDEFRAANISYIYKP